jgi:hypothetical protein
MGAFFEGESNRDDATLRSGVKRAILPAAISESTAASCVAWRERWLAKTVGGESSYQGDEVAGSARA